MAPKGKSPFQQALITVIPKREKDQATIKGWKPITLSPVIEKLLKSAVVMGLKRTRVAQD